MTTALIVAIAVAILGTDRGRHPNRTLTSYSPRDLENTQ